MIAFIDGAAKDGQIGVGIVIFNGKTKFHEISMTCMGTGKCEVRALEELSKWGIRHKVEFEKIYTDTAELLKYQTPNNAIEVINRKNNKDAHILATYALSERAIKRTREIVEGEKLFKSHMIYRTEKKSTFIIEDEIVDMTSANCTCDSFLELKKAGIRCRHIIAVMYFRNTLTSYYSLKIDETDEWFAPGYIPGSTSNNYPDIFKTNPLYYRIIGNDSIRLLVCGKWFILECSNFNEPLKRYVELPTKEKIKKDIKELI